MVSTSRPRDGCSSFRGTGRSAFALVITPAPVPMAVPKADDATVDALKAVQTENAELRTILDTATDGVIVIDARAASLSQPQRRGAVRLSRPASSPAALHRAARAGEPSARRSTISTGSPRNGVASVLNDGREVIGRVPQGGLIPLFMTMGRIGDGPTNSAPCCATSRTGRTPRRSSIDGAARRPRRRRPQKSEFLAKISHEIRTPLNAIIGFSEVMMEERFGPIGNERYRDYLKDIHVSGAHLISLINDLLDLSKIEAGKLDLNFAASTLNDVDPANASR